MNTTRDAERTRHEVLEAAFGEIWDVGFRAASVDRILQSTGVTKGALYYHFRGKTELGYAVVDEVIAKWIRDRWVDLTPSIVEQGDDVVYPQLFAPAPEEQPVDHIHPVIADNP